MARDLRQSRSARNDRSGLSIVLLVAATIPIIAGVPAPAEVQEASSEADLDYAVGIGDVLLVSVWKNPELSVTVPVRPDGKISVPLVGDVEVFGRTPMDVREHLIDRYSIFVTGPAVSVIVSQVNSREVFILGEVRSSGVYRVLRPTRLMQLVAMAGGLTEFARKEEVILLREDESGQLRRVLSLKDIQSGRRLEDNVLVQPGDTFIVP